LVAITYIIKFVDYQELHPLCIDSEAEAKDIQLKLAAMVSRQDEVGPVDLVAGVDISPVSPGKGRGAVVVLHYPTMEPVEVAVVETEVSFPYIPGLLAFRELQPVLAACRSLSVTPQLFFVDGQGLAHPRRIGLASHLGLFLNRPTIGCAKSRLTGHHAAAGNPVGSTTPLKDRDEVIGSVVRTREGSAAVFVSIGHKVDLPAAVRWVLAGCRGYRQPEPLRLAHLAASGRLSPQKPTPKFANLLSTWRH
jgi:deoxyribonuclease V